MARTLELDRADDAWNKVKEIQDNNNYNASWKDNFAAYAEGLPATILNCGLGQAAATLLAAAKKSGTNKMHDDPHYILYKDLEDWLCRDLPVAPYNKGNLMNAIVTGDRSSYIHAQAEALMWLEWMKKLAVAYLKKDKAGVNL